MVAKKTTKSDAPKADDTATPEVEVEAEANAAPMDDAPSDGIEDAVVVEAEPVAPETAKEEAAATPEQPAPTAPRQSVMPMIAAGVVSAAVGFGAAYLAFPRTDVAMTEALAKNSQMIEDLSQQVSALGGRLSELDVDGAIAGVEASVAARLDGQTATLTALDARLSALEGQPLIEGGMSPAALTALEAEITNLRAEIATQQDSMSAMAAAASAQLEETRASAAAIEEAAASKAATVAATAALAQVRAAIESGTPYAAALPDLVAVTGPLSPSLVSPAADGVPTLAHLQEGYDDVARLALAAAREQGVAGEATGGLVSFLKNQFDVRSVAPKAGEDTDAVLSRVGAALANGDLDTVLSEAATLPEVARAAMTDWLAAVSVRAEALTALNSINLSQN